MSKQNKRCINQILVTDKIIMTPDFKKKKKLYKFNFILSSFLACVLFSYGVYAEYDRNKSEEVSKEILAGLPIQEVDNTTISVEDDVIIVKALADGGNENQEVNLSHLLSPGETSSIVEAVAPDGKSYYTEAILKIPKLGIEYPVLSDTSEELLKISLNRLHGPKPNQEGNYVIVGHNYKNGKMFGKLPGIAMDDICELTNLARKTTVTYKVYTRYVVEPDDVSCTSQLTDGKKEITLITCTNGGKQRLVVKAVEI